MSKKKIMLNFNMEIKDIFRRRNIPIHDGVTYLLCLHYGIDPSFIPNDFKKKILSLGIVTKDYTTDLIKWIKPLFEESEGGYEWIPAWMDLFKEVNPGRRGVKKDVLIRMKRFFVNNPSVRKDEVIKATKNYLKSVDKAMYCKKSHKFIEEIDGTSMLADYVGQLEVEQARQAIYKDDII